MNNATYTAVCPACGEYIDYCQGHGEIGDPDGHDTLARHDRGDHSKCLIGACPDKIVQIELCEDCVLVINGYADEMDNGQAVSDALDRNWPSPTWLIDTCTGPINTDIGMWLIQTDDGDLYWNADSQEFESRAWATLYDEPTGTVFANAHWYEIELVDRDYQCEGHFSMRYCDGCHSPLGGDRHTSLAIMEAPPTDTKETA